MTQKKHWESNIIAGAATVHDGLFLLLKRSDRESFLPNVWGIPAGQVKRREDPRDACIRELLEETGLHGTAIELIGYTTFVSQRDHVELNNLQLNFLVHVDDCDVMLNPASHSDARWISLDDLDSELLDSFTRNIVIKTRKRYKEAGLHQPTA
jgi:8-oxo-dGTP diphosphatase